MHNQVDCMALLVLKTKESSEISPQSFRCENLIQQQLLVDCDLPNITLLINCSNNAWEDDSLWK